jgi:hypothetical protein
MEPPKTFISRDLAVQYGREAVYIIETGEYRAPSGRTVTIAHLLERAVQRTAKKLNGRVSYLTHEADREIIYG